MQPFSLYQGDGHAGNGTLRSIPMGVGNTSKPIPARSRKPVHPHGRGEHPYQVVEFRISYGSSPRAWGTRDCRLVDKLRHRFIPTGVGNTSTVHVDLPVTSVHPHGRGEHACSATICKVPIGSSPRAWGTQNRRGWWKPSERFIPTGVGNTFQTQLPVGGGTVHPHGRGEHQFRLRRRYKLCGSSPRAWGTRLVQQIFRIERRFIPTGVGNTT